MFTVDVKQQINYLFQYVDHVSMVRRKWRNACERNTYSICFKNSGLAMAELTTKAIDDGTVHQNFQEKELQNKYKVWHFFFFFQLSHNMYKATVCISDKEKKKKSTT